MLIFFIVAQSNSQLLYSLRNPFLSPFVFWRAVCRGLNLQDHHNRSSWKIQEHSLSGKKHKKYCTTIAHPCCRNSAAGVVCYMPIYTINRFTVHWICSTGVDIWNSAGPVLRACFPYPHFAPQLVPLSAGSLRGKEPFDKTDSRITKLIWVNFDDFNKNSIESQTNQCEWRVNDRENCAAECAKSTIAFASSEKKTPIVQKALTLICSENPYTYL